METFVSFICETFVSFIAQKVWTLWFNLRPAFQLWLAEIKTAASRDHDVDYHGDHDDHDDYDRHRWLLIFVYFCFGDNDDDDDDLNTDGGKYTFIDIALKPLVMMMMHVDSFDDDDDDDVCESGLLWQLNLKTGAKQCELQLAENPTGRFHNRICVSNLKYKI